jgi:hypothetical protein
MVQKPLSAGRLPGRATLALCAALGAAVPTQPATAKPTITIFDVPGSSGTSPASINAGGSITGVYSNGSTLGFVRAPDGTFTTFAPPGVGGGGIAINTAGVVAGNDTDSNSVTHGFVRTADGTIQSFDAPGAGTGVYEGTLAYGINNKGAITGTWINGDTNPLGDRIPHGYVRDAAGNFAEFDPPGSYSTQPLSINTKGAVTGFYADINGYGHSFIRAANGTMSTIDPPGVTESSAFCINAKGAVAGWEVVGTVYHGFVRSADGTFTQFDPTGSTATYPLGINTRGAVTGYYLDANSVPHGFMWSPNGKSVTIDPPGSTYTKALAINAKGTITGWFLDSSGVVHGFLRTK